MASPGICCFGRETNHANHEKRAELANGSGESGITPPPSAAAVQKPAAQ